MDNRNGGKNSVRLIDVWDAVMEMRYPMERKRAEYNIENYPTRFNLINQTIPRKGKNNMTKTKTNKPTHLDKRNNVSVSGVSGKRKGVQRFSDYQAAGMHVRLDGMIGETIYIVKMEVLTSDTYGDGWKIYFLKEPKGKDVYTAGVFGQYVVPSLEALYTNTHNGKLISLDSPIETLIEKAGNSYRLV